jgi:hypothetical protein
MGLCYAFYAMWQYAEILGALGIFDASRDRLEGIAAMIHNAIHMS